jgi:hypothetical protein
MGYSLEPDGEKLRANLESVREHMDHACTQAGRPLQSVRLIAVTKMQPAATVQALIDLGLKEFGESKVQEIVEKAPLLRGDFCLHMIGRLQTNKVKPALSHVGWIQSVDRDHLIQVIESRHGGPQKIKALVEVNTSGEASKSGCMPEECRRICELTAASCALEFCGLMTIGPLRAPEKKVRESFALLRRLGERNRDLAPHMELSMGMSDDFQWAIAEGSTMVRVGTALVGNR